MQLVVAFTYCWLVQRQRLSVAEQPNRLGGSGTQESAQAEEGHDMRYSFILQGRKFELKERAKTRTGEALLSGLKGDGPSDGDDTGEDDSGKSETHDDIT